MSVEVANTLAVLTPAGLIGIFLRTTPVSGDLASQKVKVSHPHRTIPASDTAFDSLRSHDLRVFQISVPLDNSAQTISTSVFIFRPTTIPVISTAASS